MDEKRRLTLRAAAAAKDMEFAATQRGGQLHHPKGGEANANYTDDNIT